MTRRRNNWAAKAALRGQTFTAAGKEVAGNCFRAVILSEAKDRAVPGQGKVRKGYHSRHFHEQCAILRRSPRRPPQNDSAYEFFRYL